MAIIQIYLCRSKKKIKKLRGYREFQSVLLHVYLDLIQVLSIFRVFEDDGINFY